jgi:hypothetical protein
MIGLVPVMSLAARAAVRAHACRGLPACYRRRFIYVRPARNLLHSFIVTTAIVEPSLSTSLLYML